MVHTPASIRLIVTNHHPMSALIIIQAITSFLSSVLTVFMSEGPSVTAAAGGVLGEVRETALPGGLPHTLPAVFIGTTRIGSHQIRSFNQRQPMTYKLLENDCR